MRKVMGLKRMLLFLLCLVFMLVMLSGCTRMSNAKAAAGPNEDFSFKSFIPGKDAFEKHNLKIGVEYQDTYHTMSIEGDIDLDGDNHADSLLCDIVSNEDSSIHINDSALTLFVNYIDSPPTCKSLILTEMTATKRSSSSNPALRRFIPVS